MHTRLLRAILGPVLRRLRVEQGRTLRDVSEGANISVGYLSEVERGRKEVSSEMLTSICGALGVPLSRVLELAARAAAQGQDAEREPVTEGMAAA